LKSQDENLIDVDTLMEPADKATFEQWVSIFNTITPFNVIQGLETIVDEHELDNEDSTILLAYVKFFEQRIKALDKKEYKKDYEGSMYG
jgi:hypothetical protein